MPDVRAEHWRSLAERERGLAATQRGEFPPGADTPPDGVTRRGFLALVGAAAALAGCAKPAAQILPYAVQPPEVTPGVPRFYATSFVLDGYAAGVLAESHEGRPTKIEGNPDHPASLGASDAQMQAAIQLLYDPHRAGSPRRGKLPTDQADIARELASLGDGSGLHLLLEHDSSPLVASLLDRLRERLPRATVHWHSAFTHANALDGAAVLGASLLPHHDLTRVEVGLALDSDLLASGPSHLRHARDWAAKRRPRAPQDAMSRWYAVEATPSCTSAAADHRLRLDDRDIPALAAAVLAEVAARLPGPIPDPVSSAVRAAPKPPVAERWIAAVAADLIAHRGAGVVAAGERQPAIVHALVSALNAALGNAGTTVVHRPPALIGDGRDGLPRLADALRAGEVDTLLILGGNPVATASGDLGFGDLLGRAKRRIRLGLYEDETSARCELFLPQSHWLESWGDARAYDGTASFVQPLIEPLFGGSTVAEALAMLVGDAASPRQRLQESWSKRGVDDASFTEGLRRGCLPDTATAPVTARIGWDALTKLVASITPAPRERIDLALRLDAKVHDGRFGNSSWLQELPDPITKLTWDNALLVSPKAAERLGLRAGSIARISAGDRDLEAPVLVQPGQADGTVALALGYGRAGAEAVAAGVGVPANALRSAGSWLISDIRISRAPGGHALAVTQEHWALEGRPIALRESLAGWRERPDFAKEDDAPQPSLRERWPQPAPQWGMVVDLAVCTGCSGCVVACQAENNIPSVGKEQVLRSREMHWLRVDRYYSGSADEPTVVLQPMACQHCEKAPCEYVCPTYATEHSRDGLNEMAYNRCVGTRFCSNNCPYKVRRFNWFDFNDRLGPVARLGKNPDVTVRARGVMEKCTYCVQRIREAEIRSRRERRPLREGELKTACQQACATGAIVFGDITDEHSEVAALRGSARAFAVLDDVGAQPRTRYLARIDNPSQELA